MPLAVRCYGHFWSRDLVNWGARGKNNSGTLMGYRIVDRVPRTTDFREQIGVYVLFHDREVVYVGQAGKDHRLFLRLRRHLDDHLRDRWTHFSWLGFRMVKRDGMLSEAQNPESRVQAVGNVALDEIEAILLQLFEPRLNKQGPKWTTTQEYLQWAPDTYYQTPAERQLEEVLQRLLAIESKIGNRKA